MRYFIRLAANILHVYYSEANINVSMCVVYLAMSSPQRKPPLQRQNPHRLHLKPHPPKRKKKRKKERKKTWNMRRVKMKVKSAMLTIEFPNNTNHFML